MILTNKGEGEGIGFSSRVVHADFDMGTWRLQGELAPAGLSFGKPATGGLSNSAGNRLEAPFKEGITGFPPAPRVPILPKM
jgi:hypothetical protein